MPVPAPPGEPEGTPVATDGVVALLGVQEHPPRTDVAILDDPAQFLLAVDDGELRLSGGLLERPQQVGVVVTSLFGRFKVQPLDDGVDRVLGGEVHQEQSQPAVVALSELTRSARAGARTRSMLR